MVSDTGSPVTDPLDATVSDPPQRLGEEHARRILERAAALDAKRSSEVDIAQLREAATAAGISVEAFEQALREDGGPSPAAAAPPRSGAIATGAMSSAQVARCTALLRDLLGEEAKVIVHEDHIEAKDDDGVTVSISASTGETSAAVAAFGRFRDRILGFYAPALIPLLLGFALVFEEEDAGIGIMVGVLLTLATTVVGGLIQQRKERAKLRKKAERIRRQLQRMLGPGSDTI